MDCKLIIPGKQYNKYHYFLTRFKELEWSGPAWYTTKIDKDGFVTEWKLVHFHPLNLGNKAATEWKAKDFAKILSKTYKAYPKLKKAFIGLIHSHNTMGAYLSGTDTNTIEDMAPDENFYGSLVVALSGKELTAFGFSWKDQYKCIHTNILDSEDIKIIQSVKIEEEWLQIGNKIEKNKPIPPSDKQMNFMNGYGYPIKNKFRTAFEEGNKDKDTDADLQRYVYGVEGGYDGY